MKVLVYTVVGFAALWLQLTVAPLVALGGVKPNLLLLTVAVLGLRWLDPWLFVYATIAGLAQDVFSHGLLGIYGISFFATAFAARLAGLSIYEQSWLFNVGGAFGLTVLEGVIAVSLFNLLDSDVPWFGWVLGQVLPAAVYNALLAPLVFYAVQRLERRLKWSPV